MDSFSVIFTRKTTFATSCLRSFSQVAGENGSTPKGKTVPHLTKEFAPYENGVGAHSFLFRASPCREERQNNLTVDFLTHLSLASYKRVIGKQRRPRSNSAERDI